MKRQIKLEMILGVLLAMFSIVILTICIYQFDNKSSNIIEVDSQTTGLIDNGDKWNIDLHYIPNKIINKDEVVQQVYEYSFTNDSSSSDFVIKLLTVPTVENMSITYAYSSTKVTDPSTLVTISSYEDQIIAKDEIIYVYIIATVSDTSQTASYSQSMKWQVGKPVQLTFVFGYNIPNVSGYVVAGAPIPDIAIPEMPNNILGVQLVGWYSNSACTNEVSLSNPIRQDTTLYAKTTYVTTDWIFYDSTHSPKGYTLQAGTNPSAENLPANLIIPPQYNDGTNGLGNIVKFNSNTFKEVTTLESVDVQAKVRQLGQYSFYGCTNLKSVKLQDNTSGLSFGAYLFKNCTSLTEIVIPKGVATVSLADFNGCTSLKKVTLPSTVTVIQEQTFWGCTALKEINLPEGFTNLGNYTFRACSSLKHIDLPSSLTRIGNNAFQSCSSLESITIPAGVTSISSEVFQGCSALSSVTFLGTITSIGNFAFRGCSSLASITLPSGLTYLGWQALAGTKLTNLTIPASVEKMYKFVFSGCTTLKSVTFEDTTTWYVTDNDDYTEGTAITVTNATRNATYLTSASYYAGKYWYKV